MAVTTQTVNSIGVVQVGADSDTYDDLRTALAGTTHQTAIPDMPQATQVITPLYFPAGVGATFDSAFLILSQRSGIFVHAVDTAITANRIGLLIANGGTIVINTDIDSRPGSVGAQRPSIAQKLGSSWQSVHKTFISPLQIEDSTLIFNTDENSGGNANNAIVLSRVHRSTLIRNPSAAGDIRLFLGNALDFDGVNAIGWSQIVFNDTTLGTQRFDNVKIIGNTVLSIQGLTTVDKMRFIDNTLVQKIQWYAGNVPANRRVCAIFNNMSFLISAANNFPDFSMISHINLTGIVRPFTNSYDVRATDVSGNLLENVSVVGFCRRSTDAEVSLETALDMSARYNAYAYASSRYGEPDSFNNAGTLITNRFESNFSLSGQDELVTNTDGLTIVSGETAVTRPQFRSIHQIVTLDSTSWGRVTFVGHFLRFSRYGYIMQDISVPVMFDTVEVPDDLQVTASMVADSRITEASHSTVSAYVSISTLSQLYDYIRHLEYDSRKNKHIRDISANGKTITFPAGTVFAVDATQSVPVSVSYGSSFPTYTFKNDSVITSDSNFDTINLTNTGNVSTASFSDSVGVADQSGVPVLINTVPGEMRLRIEAYEGDTLRETITGTSGADGMFLHSYVEGRSLRIYSKKKQYFFKRLDFDVGSAPSITIELGLRPHLSASIDLSAYRTESDSSLTNKIYFDFQQPKSYFRCGAINTTGQIRLTQALLDDRISTQEGLEFFAYYNTRPDTAQYHSGQPFLADADRIEIHEDYLDFAVIPTQNTGNIVRLGTPVFKKDTITAHVAPLILGRRVTFDNLQFIVPADTLASVANSAAMAVWNSPLAGLDTVDSVGEHVAALTSGGGGSGGATAVEIREEIDTNSQVAQNVSAIKTKVDLLTMIGDAVKATIAGETVTTDTASRNASKADLSALQTSVAGIQSNVANMRVETNAIQGVVTRFQFDSGNQVLADIATGNAIADSVAAIATKIAEIVITNSKVEAVIDQEVTTDTASRDASKATIPLADITAIRTQVGRFGFNANNDVKATLDNEEVVTDAASRNASKADLTGIATTAQLLGLPAPPTVAEIVAALEAAGTKLTDTLILAQLILNWFMSDIIVQDDTLIFRFGGTVLGTFNRRTQAIGSDWSGGRTLGP